MDSADVRWLLAILFILFLVAVVLSDLVRRRSSTRRTRHEGFRDRRAGGEPGRHNKWKIK